MSEPYAQAIAEFVRADASKHIVTDVHQLAREIHPKFPDIPEQLLIALIDVARIRGAAALWAPQDPAL